MKDIVSEGHAKAQTDQHRHLLDFVLSFAVIVTVLSTATACSSSGGPETAPSGKQISSVAFSRSVGQIKLPSEVDSAAFSPSGRYAYFGYGMSGTGSSCDTCPNPLTTNGVAVVDTASGKVVRTMHMPADPTGLVTSADGKLLYGVSEDYGKLWASDALTGRVVASFSDKDAHSYVVRSPDGSRVYAYGNSSRLEVIDTKQQKVVQNVDLAVGLEDTRPLEIEGIAVSPSGSTVYAQIGGAHGEDGRFYVGAYGATDLRLERKTTVGVAGSEPARLVLTPNGKMLISTDYGTGIIRFLDASTFALRDTTKVNPSSQTAKDVVVAPDGKKAYVTSGDDDQIDALDIAGGESGGTLFQVSGVMTISPDGRHAYTYSGAADSDVVQVLGT